MARLWRLALCALVAVLATACPRRPVKGPAPSTDGPVVLWTIQLEGDPWPWKVAGQRLLVWQHRFAHEGFLFPIKLESYGVTAGKSHWSVPIRPWLWSTDSPWSHNAVLLGGHVGAWVKGNVARTLVLTTGEEAWSIPLCNGLAPFGAHLVVASESRLLILEPGSGRTTREVSLTAPLAAPPVVFGGVLVGLAEDRHLVAVRLADGALLWRHKVGGTHGMPDRPLAAGDLVLLPHLPGDAARGSGASALLEARRVSNGALAWRRSVASRAGAGKASPLAGLHVSGDLLLLPEPSHGCLSAWNVKDGTPRFRRCGLNLSSTPVRHGEVLYALAMDKRSAEALRKGEPWSTVDFPLVAVSAATGKVRAVRRFRHGGRGLRQERAVRLQTGPMIGDVLYLLQRNRFLTALRLKPSKASR
jgi:hypothetical protein